MDQLFSPWRSHYISSFSSGDKAEPTGEKRCVFCSAYEGKDDESTLLVYRGKEVFVLMNRFPYNSGHLMVIPVRHSADFASMTESESLECVRLLQAAQQALRELSQPQGFNLGMNLGRISGAGIDDHFHWHIVPRWNGDTNFLPILADVKVVSEDMEQQWKKLHEIFPRIAALRAPSATR